MEKILIEDEIKYIEETIKRIGDPLELADDPVALLGELLNSTKFNTKMEICSALKNYLYYLQKELKKGKYIELTIDYTNAENSQIRLDKSDIYGIFGVKKYNSYRFVVADIDRVVASISNEDSYYHKPYIVRPFKLNRLFLCPKNENDDIYLREIFNNYNCMNPGRSHYTRSGVFVYKNLRPLTEEDIRLSVFDARDMFLEKTNKLN